MRFYNINNFFFGLISSLIITKTLADQKSVTVKENAVGKIGDRDYELWFRDGKSSAIFNEDGTFTCKFENTGDTMCKSGYLFDGTKTHELLGHIYADFEFKLLSEAMDFSYLSIYGSAENPNASQWPYVEKVEFSIIDASLSPEWDSRFSGIELGEYTLDGYKYTIYQTNEYQYYSVIKGKVNKTKKVDVTAHIKQMESFGMKLGKMKEISVLIEAGSYDSISTGRVEVTKSKIYFEDVPEEKSVTVKENAVGKIGDRDYELWSRDGKSSATFNKDGTFTCNFEDTGDTMCKSGYLFDGSKTYEELGHIYADFEYKVFSVDLDFSYVSIYGWAENPKAKQWPYVEKVEFSIIDTSLSPEWDSRFSGIELGNYTLDGFKYTIYQTNEYQYYSVIKRKVKSNKKVDVTAHIKQMENFGMKLGKIREISVLIEAGSYDSISTGRVDVTKSNIYFEDADDETSCSQAILDMGYKCCSSNCEVLFTDKDGSWGVEKDEWCGCGNKPAEEIKCSYKIVLNGYSCCPSDCEVVFTDNEGSWGIHNDEWCGCGL